MLTRQTMLPFDRMEGKNVFNVYVKHRCLVHTFFYTIHATIFISQNNILPSGQNHADSWWRGIPGEIWVVSETRIHGESEGKFVGIPYGFIGDKTVANFEGNPLRFSGEFM